MSAEKAEYVRKYVDEGLRKGHIRESDSPAGYLLHIVPKGDEYREPTIESGLRQDTNRRQYSGLDSDYTSIWLYEYLVIPFRLTNALATFQAYINNVLCKYLDVFVVVYLDDILMYSKIYDDYVRDVQKVLQALADAKIKIKPEKTEFHKTEVKFLRYIPKPGTVKEVQSFLGFANFYQQFIKDYSKIAAPLTELTKKDKVFEWSAKAKEAFQELKIRFSTKLILMIFDLKKPSIVETDTSDKAIGACLSQADNKGKLRPVAYLLRKFTLAESNYEVHDKELLAIIEAFRHWRYADIATFNMKIHYRKGSENARADAMSRREDYMKGEPKKGIQLLVRNANSTLQVNKIAATSVIDTSAIPDEIRKALRNDSLARSVRESPEEHVEFQDRPIRGHPGVTKMVQTVQAQFWFPKIRLAIEDKL
ncbi:hypothetical protein Q7P35_007418 [Cladosporium inversicolor]